MEDTLRDFACSCIRCKTSCLNPYSNGRYSESGKGSRAIGTDGGVLILILMEDTLRAIRAKRRRAFGEVLILILMEDTLRVLIGQLLLPLKGVLILILMEDTLRVSTSVSSLLRNVRLNPYSNGRYSESYQRTVRITHRIICLNPYSNGRYSESQSSLCWRHC